MKEDSLQGLILLLAVDIQRLQFLDVCIQVLLLFRLLVQSYEFQKYAVDCA